MTLSLSKPTTKKRGGLASLTLALSLTGALTLGAGCASAPRPVPPSAQPMASIETAGVVISVPRLDSGEFPGDVLDVSNALLVMVENRGTQEILIDPEGFSLGPSGGPFYSSVAPQQLAMKVTTPTPGATETAQGGDLLAWRGGGGFRGGGSFHGGGGFRGGGSFHVRPAPSFRGGGGSFHLSAPHYSGGWHRSPVYRGGYGGYGLGRFYGRGYWGGSLWGGGPWIGGPWYANYFYWDGPRYYAWSRDDAMRLALPAGKLAPGARTGGFLYFPKVEQKEGTPLVLQWQVRDAATQQVLGVALLPLELSSD